MRVGMLLMGGVYPPDIRVRKEAKLLVDAGHEVFLLTSDRNGRPLIEQLDGMTVVRYPQAQPWLSRKVGASVNLASWLQPVWRGHIRSFASDHRIQVLHCHDLNGVKTAHSVARSVGLPLVYDMHENYAHVVASWKRSWVAEHFQTPARYERYESWAVRSADTVVVVSDEMMARAVELGADPARVIRFANVDDFEGGETWVGPHEPFEVAFAGGFTSSHRGLDVLIRAFDLVRHEMPEARLVLMGSGPLEAEIGDLARQLGLEAAIEFTGWVEQEEMRRRLARASVGVIPFVSTIQTEAALPHKLFQYMALGLPMVVTDCRAMRAVIDTTGAGLVAHAGDPEDLARKIVELADPAVATRVSDAALSAHRELYSLKAEGRSLVGVYERLAK